MTRLIPILIVSWLLLAGAGWGLLKLSGDLRVAEHAAENARQAVTEWREAVARKDAEITRRDAILAQLREERRQAEAVARHFREALENARKDPICEEYLSRPLPPCVVRLLVEQGLFGPPGGDQP